MCTGYHIAKAIGIVVGGGTPSGLSTGGRCSDPEPPDFAAGIWRQHSPVEPTFREACAGSSSVTGNAGCHDGARAPTIPTNLKVDADHPVGALPPERRLPCIDGRQCGGPQETYIRCADAISSCEAGVTSVAARREGADRRCVFGRIACCATGATMLRGGLCLDAFAITVLKRRARVCVGRWRIRDCVSSRIRW